MAYVAQSAAAAFNPAMTINRQVTEAPRVHGTMPASEATERSIDLYRRLDLPDPESIGRRYPHQVSGETVAALDGRNGVVVWTGAPHTRRADDSTRRHNSN